MRRCRRGISNPLCSNSLSLAVPVPYEALVLLQPTLAALTQRYEAEGSFRLEVFRFVGFRRACGCFSFNKNVLGRCRVSGLQWFRTISGLSVIRFRCSSRIGVFEGYRGLGFSAHLTPIRVAVFWSVCICMYACMHVCVCMYIYIYIYIFIYLFISIHR